MDKLTRSLVETIQKIVSNTTHQTPTTGAQSPQQPANTSNTPEKTTPPTKK